MLVGDTPVAVHFAQSNCQSEDEPAFLSRRARTAPHDGDGEGDIIAGGNGKLFYVERLGWLGNCSPGVIASVPAWYQPVAVLVSQSASEFS
jgi:hypothetical protein